MQAILSNDKIIENALRIIPCKKITTIEEITTLITAQQYDHRISRFRSSFLYRGLPNISFHMLSSLQRNCKKYYNVIENSILRNFAKYAISEDPLINESVWHQMVIGQHHGLPTRLIDWSYSPLVALHFATSGEDIQNMDKHDCVIWKIDIEEIHSLLPRNYRQILENENAYLFTVNMLNRAANNLADYDNSMGDKSLVLLEPPSFDQRIINQYSYFSVTPSGILCMEDFLAKNTKNTMRYIIDKNLRWRVRDMLDQININERIMYPGLDGLTLWLKRHYYVK